MHPSPSSEYIGDRLVRALAFRNRSAVAQALVTAGAASLRSSCANRPAPPSNDTTIRFPSIRLEACTRRS